MNNMVGLGNRDLSNMSHMCASVEAMWLKMTAIKISGSFILVLLMVGIWKCPHDTLLCSKIIFTYYLCIVTDIDT